MGLHEESLKTDELEQFWLSSFLTYKLYTDIYDRNRVVKNDTEARNSDKNDPKGGVEISFNFWPVAYPSKVQFSYDRTSDFTNFMSLSLSTFLKTVDSLAILTTYSRGNH